MYETILKTVEQRKKLNIRRNDIIDLMLDVMEENDEKEVSAEDSKSKKINLTNASVIGNAMVFLITGYDSAANFLAFAFYELTKNPNAKAKLLKEIEEAYAKNHGDFPTYSEIMSMPYLDAVFHEINRLYSLAGLVLRLCSQDYTIPGTNVKLRANKDMALINISGIHVDPDLYPEPEQFRPERFLKENKTKNHP